MAKLTTMGFDRNSLEWLGSYLGGRTQQVKSNGQVSGCNNIRNGVPQGSILGPLLFTVLVSDIRKSLEHTKFHQYADDLQLEKNSKICDATKSINEINSDLESISKYSISNGLRLNYEKSKFMIIGTRQSIKKIGELDLPPIVLDGHILDREKQLKNLGVIFDEYMTWVKHINKIVVKLMVPYVHYTDLNDF